MENKVTKKECMEAIEYLFQQGFINEMTSDKKFYVSILLNKVANDYKVKLHWDTSEDEDNIYLADITINKK